MATWDDICAAALALPGARESTMLGEPCLKVGSKGFVHTWRGRIFMKLDRHHQELLFEAWPDVFSPFTAGAMRWSWVEIEALDAEELGGLVHEAWSGVVPKKVSRSHASARV